MAGELNFRMRNKDARQMPPILFIHGAMGNLTVWLSLSRALAKLLPDRASFLLDLPGHGDSKGAGCATVEEFANAVAAFMDSQGIEKIIAVGHSMGGAITQQLALDHPDRLEQMILLSTGARIGVSPAIIQALEDDFDAATDMFKDFAFSKGLSEDVYAQAVAQIKTTDPKVAVSDFIACSNFNVVEKIKAVKVPAMVCCGDHDLLTPAKFNHLLAGSLGCACHEFEGAGHMLQIERTQLLAQTIARFIQGEI